MRKIIVVLLTILFVSGLKAEIKQPSIISDNLVLQQLSEVNFWETANPDEKLLFNVSCRKKPYKTVAGKEGKWSLKIVTPLVAENHHIHSYFFKEVLLYQNESGENDAKVYRQMFTNMIKSWRKEFWNPSLLNYFVQLFTFDKQICVCAVALESQTFDWKIVANMVCYNHNIKCRKGICTGSQQTYNRSFWME